jgi:hypothetical protein
VGYTGTGVTMSRQLHCNCGWSSQVSDYYLGDRVTCPDCGNRLQVHQQSGVPYGYAPYPTWQKRAPARAPRQRSRLVFVEDPHASPAFWLGLMALILVLTGCGAIPGVMLALFAIGAWSRSRRFTGDFGLPATPRAAGGLVMSSVSLGLAAVMLLAFVDCRQSDYHRCEVITEPPTVDCVEQSRQRDQQRARERAEKQEGWRQWQAEHAYRYPEPEPVTPRNEFETRQLEYSRQVREEREGAETGLRYQDE